MEQLDSESPELFGWARFIKKLICVIVLLMNNESQDAQLTSPEISQSTQESTLPSSEEPQQDTPKRESKILKVAIYILVSIILLALGAFGFWFYQEKLVKGPKPTSPSITSATPTSPVLPTAEPEEKTSKCNLANEHPYLEDLSEIRICYEWGEDFGYRVSYPNIWTPSIRGASGVNLALEIDGKWMVFISVAHTDLTLDNYDKIEQGYELSPPSPIIDSTSKVISKEIIKIKGRQVLKVYTSSDDANHTYYLIDNGLEENKAVYAIRMHEDISEEDIDKILKSFTPEFL